MSEVNPILTHPDIWPEISPKGVEPFDVPYRPDCLYVVLNGGQGVVIFHPFRDGMKVHPNIVPEYRGKEALDAIGEAFDAMLQEGCRALYAEIDASKKHLAWTARYFGFTRLESGKRDIYVRRQLDS